MENFEDLRGGPSNIRILIKYFISPPPSDLTGYPFVL